MASIQVHAGDYKSPQDASVFFGQIVLDTGDGRVYRELSDIESVEVATEETVKKLSGTVGWGVAGAVLLGPVGLLAGLLLGGRKEEVTFILLFKDGKKILATAKKKVYTQLLAAAF